ncbi:MAG: cation-transporting P-type ATPase, partial [Actinobacteria bacterium]
KIAYLTQSIKTELSPLQKQMITLTKIIGGLAVFLGVLFFFIGGFVKGFTTSDRLIFAIGIIVANVPEGLLPTVTLSLALGVQRMVKRHALIKKLASVETLGSTNVIATDKTGTLTQNEMTVREMWISGQNVDVTGVGYEPKGKFEVEGKEIDKAEIEKKFNLLFKTGVLSNTSKLLPPNEEQKKWTIIGDPTEAALLVAAAKGDFDLDKTYKEAFLVHQFPFESVRKRMSVIYRYPKQTIAYIKGAPEETLNLCDKIWLDGKVKKLDEKMRDEILKQNDDYAKRALRVLAFAIKEISQDTTSYKMEDVEKGLTFVGLMAMMDPPRVEVTEAVRKAKTAGIKIIMITGDYGLTADSIAHRIGIVKKESRIITGADIENLSDEELSKAIEEEEVLFARVSPEHKMRVVSVLKSKGHVVAVTGDGVNDAPALKKADIGIAMGISGTDVAKEAADMILTDDNFASIVNAIEEGRAVFDNIRRFITYILASNIPQIVPFILFVVFKVPLSLTILQILAIDLGTDIFPALALGTEKPELSVMERPPRNQKEKLLNARVLLRAYGFLGPVEAAASFGAFLFMFFQNGFGFRAILDLGTQSFNVYKSNPIYIQATTMSLGAIVTTQIGNGYAVRSLRESIFKIGFFTNRFFLWGIASEIAFIFFFINVPPFNSIFGLAPVGSLNWIFLFALAPLPLIFDEVRKLIVRRFFPVKA